MTQYIDKDALVTEIENLKENARMSYSDCADGRLDVCKELLSFINTFEVKEGDLEKIINDYFKDWKFDDELDIMIKPNNYSASFTDLKDIAKHFFELGLKAQRKSISIQNVDDVLKESGVDPDSKVAKMFKESYYAAIDKLLEQKRK